MNRGQQEQETAATGIGNCDTFGATEVWHEDNENLLSEISSITVRTPPNLS